MAAVGNNAPATSAHFEEPKEVIVTEIPKALEKLLLLVVKNFYSAEQYIIVYYVMRAVCIREEKLRERIQVELKQLREWIAHLKRDKIIRERLLTQKNENNRNINMIFYFINYRALRNVLTYKIDHMRQRLETREKDTVQKAHYKCTRCSLQYETLDMDRIFDPITQSLICWRCKGEVELDESAGPTSETRSSLARFNEQMLPFFALIRELAGIQLAPQLNEPDISKYMDDPAANETMEQQKLDFSAPAATPAPVSLGGIAFRKDQMSRSAMMNAEHITVELNSSNANSNVAEVKETPLWLQNPRNSDEIVDIAAAAVIEKSKPPTPSTRAFDISLLARLEGMDDHSSLNETNDHEDEHSDDNELMVAVQGEMMPISSVTTEMIENMTDEEREAYVAAYADYTES